MVIVVHHITRCKALNFWSPFHTRFPEEDRRNADGIQNASIRSQTKLNETSVDFGKGLPKIYYSLGLVGISVLVGVWVHHLSRVLSEMPKSKKILLWVWYKAIFTISPQTGKDFKVLKNFSTIRRLVSPHTKVYPRYCEVGHPFFRNAVNASFNRNFKMYIFIFIHTFRVVSLL